MNRRSIRAALAAALLGAGLLLPIGAGPVAAYGDAKGAPCADFNDGDGAGQGYMGTEVVVRNALSKAACSKDTYTLVVLSGDGLTEFGRLALPGDPSWTFNGIPVAQWDLDIGVNTATVCFYMTSSSGNKIIDRAPDIGCVPVSQGSSAGGRGHG